MAQYLSYFVNEEYFWQFLQLIDNFVAAGVANLIKRIKKARSNCAYGFIVMLFFLIFFISLTIKCTCINNLMESRRSRIKFCPFFLLKSLCGYKNAPCLKPH